MVSLSIRIYSTEWGSYQELGSRGSIRKSLGAPLRPAGSILLPVLSTPPPRPIGVRCRLLVVFTIISLLSPRHVSTSIQHIIALTTAVRENRRKKREKRHKYKRMDW